MERFEQRAERRMTRAEVEEQASIWRAPEDRRIDQYRGPYAVRQLDVGMIVAGRITADHITSAPAYPPLYRVAADPYGLGDPVIDWDAS